MNVGELKKLLEQYPDHLPVIVSLHSDYDIVDSKNVGVIRAVPTDWGVMHSHPTMSDENKAKERSFLYIG